MKRIPVAVVIASFIAMVASPVLIAKTDSDSDHRVDFSKYETFAWGERPESTGPENFSMYSLSGERIRSNVELGLRQRGFSGTDPDGADILITYHLIVEEKVEVSRYLYPTSYGHSYGHRGGYRHYGRHGYGYSGYRGYSGYGGYSSGYGYGYDYDQYTEVTIVLDFIDAETNEVIWRGWRSFRSDDLEISDKSIRKSIRKILKKFPPEIG